MFELEKPPSLEFKLQAEINEDREIEGVLEAESTLMHFFILQEDIDRLVIPEPVELKRKRLRKRWKVPSKE